LTGFSVKKTNRVIIELGGYGDNRVSVNVWVFLFGQQLVQFGSQIFLIPCFAQARQIGKGMGIQGFIKDGDYRGKFRVSRQQGERSEDQGEEIFANHIAEFVKNGFRIIQSDIRVNFAAFQQRVSVGMVFNKNSVKFVSGVCFGIMEKDWVRQKSVTRPAHMYDIRKRFTAGNPVYFERALRDWFGQGKSRPPFGDLRQLYGKINFPAFNLFLQTAPLIEYRLKRYPKNAGKPVVKQDAITRKFAVFIIERIGVEAYGAGKRMVFIPEGLYGDDFIQGYIRYVPEWNVFYCRFKLFFKKSSTAWKYSQDKSRNENSA